MTFKLSPCNTTLLTYNDTCLYGNTPLLTYNDTCLYGNTTLLTNNDIKIVSMQHNFIDI